jgi:predicted CxxxxCH...CXXCH cytochrome family protein
VDPLLPDAGPADAGRGDAGQPLTCHRCHGSALNDAPPSSVDGGVDRALRGVGAHQAHLQNSSWHRTPGCWDCHLVPKHTEDLGHIDEPPAEVVFSPQARGLNPTASWNGDTCAVWCHNPRRGGGALSEPRWTRTGATQAYCGDCHGLPPPKPHPQNVGSDCSPCHPDAKPGLGFVDPSRHIDGRLDVDVACGTCHALPPATGAHLKHAGLAAPLYGGLGTAADVANPAGYAFGCGYCHPLDASRHMNGGLAELELFSSSSGGLKALTPSTASYTPGATESTDAHGITYTLGTCNNVYCHSRATYETPGGVPEPGVDFSVAGYPIVYPSYALTRGRAYASIAWGGPNPGCGGCHGLPPRTAAPLVGAMAGQSHSFIDAEGRESGHAFNHGLAQPLACRTCHRATVAAASSTSRDDAGVSQYGPVPIAGFDRHVNGGADVVFDTVEPIAYPTPLTLEGAGWEPATATCTNVACHRQQSSVRHGTPFRYRNAFECNACHQF